MLQDLPFYLWLLLEVDLQERLWGGFGFFSNPSLLGTRLELSMKANFPRR